MKVYKLVRTALLVLLITLMGAGQTFSQNAASKSGGNTINSGESIHLDINTLPAGKSVTITFEVTVDSPFPSGPTQVCNQGVVSGSNFSDVFTDDPSVGGAADPTCTMVTKPDIGVIAINAPTSDCGLSSVKTVTITISNFTAFAQSGFDVQFQVTGPIGTGPVTETFTGALPASGNAVYTFTGTADLSTPGVYTVTATTLLADDGNTANDATAANVENEGACIKPFLFVSNKITLKQTKQNTPAGDIHSNGALTVEKGTPSTYNSNLTAVGKITINTQNTITGNVKSPIAITNNGTVNGTITVGAVPPQPLPGLSYSAGGQNKTVPQNGTLTLAPGSYNNVTLNSFSTLKLTSGNYFFTSLKYNSSTTTTAVLEIDLSSGNPITLNVVSNLFLGNEIEIRLLPNGEDDSELVTFNSKQSTAMKVGREAYFLGTLNAPNSKVTLDKNSQLRGAMCVKELIVERDCLFLHFLSPGSLPGPGNLPKSAPDDEETLASESPITDYALEQNYPNPFNPTTQISFALPDAGEVSLAIYNLNGQLVKRLVAGEMNAGRHSIMWDAKDERGQQVASGVYVYVIKAGSFSAQRKFVLMK